MELGFGDLSFSDSSSSSDDDEEVCFRKKTPQTKMESLSGFCPSFLCEASHWSYRYLILGLICLINVALSFNDDMTDGLAKVIIEVMDINTLTYEYLDGFGTIPTIVLCILGGYLIDRYLGIRYSLIVASVAGLVGEMMFCIGVFTSHYWLMVLGTTITFVAEEMLELLLYIYQARWFKNKELTFALGLNSSAECLGSALAMSLSNAFYEFLSFVPAVPSVHLGLTCLLGPTAALISLVCCLLVVCLDSRRSKHSRKKSATGLSGQKCVKFYKYISLNVILLSIAFALYEPVIESFSTIGQLFFVKKFRLSTNMASLGNGLLSWLNIVLLPLFGLVIDITGYHVYWSVLSVILALITHSLLLTFSQPFVPFVAQVIYALSDSLFTTSMEPLPAFVVPESQEATIYGIMDSFGNLMFVFCAFATGHIADTASYNVLEMFYIILLIISLIALVNLLVLDGVSVVGVTNISGKMRRKREQEEDSSSSDSDESTSSESDSDSSSSSTSSSSSSSSG